MSRLPRNYQNTNLFHNMVQGINKSFIFNNPVDIKYYIKLMYEIKAEYNIQIIAYCIMNNHAHILIKAENINQLSQYMKRINIRFSIYYNKKYNRVGYVFRDRYKSQAIYSEKHMYNCISYIFNNPVKAGICSNPEEYPYSNFRSIKMPQNIAMDEDFCVLDTEEDIEINSDYMINKILQENNITISELLDNKIILAKIIKIMKNQYNYSLREIAERLKIGRETVRKMYMK